MRNRMYGGVRGRKTKVGGNYFVFLLLDLVGSFFNVVDHFFTNHRVGVNLSVTNLIK